MPHPKVREPQRQPACQCRHKGHPIVIRPPELRFESVHHALCLEFTSSVGREAFGVRRSRRRFGMSAVWKLRQAAALHTLRAHRGLTLQHPFQVAASKDDTAFRASATLEYQFVRQFVACKRRGAFGDGRLSQQIVAGELIVVFVRAIAFLANKLTHFVKIPIDLVLHPFGYIISKRTPPSCIEILFSPLKTKRLEKI